MRRLTPAFFFTLLLLLLSSASIQAQTDISGTWEITWEGMRGATTSVFTFQQEGDTFTGTAQIETMGRAGGRGAGQIREVPVTDGKINGDQITFMVTIGQGPRAMTPVYSATVSGDSMEGTMRTERRESPFTGVRKEKEGMRFPRPGAPAGGTPGAGGRRSGR